MFSHQINCQWHTSEVAGNASRNLCSYVCRRALTPLTYRQWVYVILLIPAAAVVIKVETHWLT